MKKLRKQVPVILVLLIFMAVSTYVEKHNKSQKNESAVKVQLEKAGNPSPLVSKPTGAAEQNNVHGISDGQASEKRASTVQERQPVQTGAVPATPAVEEISVQQKAKTVPEVTPARSAAKTAVNGWTTIPPPDFSPKTKWHRSNLERHWEKHQAEFPEFRNAQEYGIAALFFFEHPPKGTLAKNNLDGDKMFYHQASNTFGVMTADGTAKTMFRPSAGINYWRKQ